MSLLPDDATVMLPTPLPMYLVRALIESALVEGTTVTALLTRAVRRDLREQGVDPDGFRYPNPQEAWSRLVALVDRQATGREVGLTWLPEDTFRDVLAVYRDTVLPLDIWAVMTPLQRARVPADQTPTGEYTPTASDRARAMPGKDTPTDALLSTQGRGRHGALPGQSTLGRGRRKKQ